MRRLLISLAVLCSLAAAVTAAAEHAALRVIQAPGGNPDPAFAEFYREYHAMLMGWWGHGGESTAQGTWWAVAASVRHPGQSRPHFVITLTREAKGRSVAVLTFSVPPRAQGQVLLAAHAAYDATVGAMLGQPRYQGTLEWRGAFEDTVLIVPSFRFAGAIPSGDSAFYLFVQSTAQLCSADEWRQTNNPSPVLLRSCSWRDSLRILSWQMRS